MKYNKIKQNSYAYVSFFNLKLSINFEMFDSCQLNSFRLEYSPCGLVVLTSIFSLFLRETWATVQGGLGAVPPQLLLANVI